MRCAARRVAALALTLGVIATACAGATSPSSPPAAGSGVGSGTTTLTAPLPPFDPEEFRKAEADLRRQGRERAEVSKVGPGAVTLVGLMDRTVSFLLTQLPARMKAASGPAGRLAAPFQDMPPPGAPIFGVYLMTTELFKDMIQVGQDGDCPCSRDAVLPTTIDEVDIDGKKGLITSSIFASGSVNGSKVSVEITMKVTGEVRDTATGAIVYKVSAEAKGHADGDACPDASGIAPAHLAFSGTEDYFTETGTKSGTRVIEGLGGDLRIKADDNAKLASVDITATGGFDLLIRLAANRAAPSFEKAWRSGMCIAVTVSPEGGDVDKDSVTTVTAKVRHKIENQELDKPVEATLDGVKSIDPTGSKQKAPATVKYTAGSKDGDRGRIDFKSVSNRGIGERSVTFSVAGGWVINSTGTSNEGFQGFVSNTLRVTIKDLKVATGKDNALSGSGTMTLTGPISAGPCRGDLNQTIPISASGSLVGTGSDAVLRLRLNTAAPANGGSTLISCPGAGSASIPNEGYSDRYGETLGEFDLPSAGGTTSVNRASAVGGVMNVSASGTFTVVRAKR
jgi:hypothetical protein